MPVNLTVLMLLYDRPVFMRQAIESVLTQSLTQFKFILLDNGSKNELVLDIAKAYANQDNRIEVLREEQGLGLAKGRAALLDRVQTPFFATIEDDDFWHSDKLALQMEAINTNDNISAVTCSYQFIDEHNNNIGEKLRPDGYYEASKGLHAMANISGYSGSGQLLRTDMVKNVNGWRAFFTNADDADLFYRLNEAYDFVCVSQKLVYYRLWGENTHLRQDGPLFKMMAILSALYRRNGLEDPIDYLDNTEEEMVEFIMQNYVEKAYGLSVQLNFKYSRSFIKYLLRTQQTSAADCFYQKCMQNPTFPKKNKLRYSYWMNHLKSRIMR